MQPENIPSQQDSNVKGHPMVGYGPQRDNGLERDPVNKEKRKLTPLKAIRGYCFQCASSWRKVKNCQERTCWLYSYRQGHNPSRMGVGRVGGNPNFYQRRNLKIGSSTLEDQEKCR